MSLLFQILWFEVSLSLEGGGPMVKLVLHALLGNSVK